MSGAVSRPKACAGVQRCSALCWACCVGEYNSHNICRGEYNRSDFCPIFFLCAYFVKPAPAPQVSSLSAVVLVPIQHLPGKVSHGASPTEILPAVGYQLAPRACDAWLSCLFEIRQCPAHHALQFLSHRYCRPPYMTCCSPQALPPVRPSSSESGFSKMPRSCCPRRPKRMPTQSPLKRRVKVRLKCCRSCRPVPLT